MEKAAAVEQRFKRIEEVHLVVEEAEEKELDDFFDGGGGGEGEAGEQ